jgi:hypothetical protein
MRQLPFGGRCCDHTFGMLCFGCIAVVGCRVFVEVTETAPSKQLDISSERKCHDIPSSNILGKHACDPACVMSGSDFKIMYIFEQTLA